MIADLVLLAVLSAILFASSRRAFRTWLSLHSIPWTALRRAPLLRVTVLLLVISMSAWAQAMWVSGVGVVLENAWTGMAPAEAERCFTRQRNVLQNGGLEELPGARCPLGGGRFQKSNQGLTCQAHGQAP